MANKGLNVVAGGVALHHGSLKSLASGVDTEQGGVKSVLEGLVSFM